MVCRHDANIGKAPLAPSWYRSNERDEYSLYRSANDQFRQLRGEAFEIVKTAVAVVVVAAITVFHTVQASLQALSVAHAADTEIRQNFVDNHNLLAGMSDSQNQIIIVVKTFA